MLSLYYLYSTRDSQLEIVEVGGERTEGMAQGGSFAVDSIRKTSGVR